MDLLERFFQKKLWQNVIWRTGAHDFEKENFDTRQQQVKGIFDIVNLQSFAVRINNVHW